MKCLKLFLLFGWGLTSNLSILFAQENIVEKYIQEGIENNLALQQQNFDIQKSLAALGEAKGLFFPSVSFQASYTLAGGGRTISLPLGDLLNPAYTALNDLTNSSNFPMLENSNEQFLPNNFHETKFQVVQPLFNSDIYFNYKAKEKLISVEKARREVFIQELRKDIKVAYLQYLQTLEVLQIYDETESVLKEVLRVNQKLVKNDQATPEIVYGAEAELSQLASDRAEADKNRQVTQSYFNFLLNRELDTDIQVDSSILNDLTGVLDLNALQGQALSSRAELNQLESARQANQQLLKLNQFSKYPKLNMAGDLGFQGFGYTFDRDQDFWLINFSLVWDLFKGKQNRYRTQQSRIELDKINVQEEELQKQIRLQVRNAYYALNASRKSIEASQAQLKQRQRNFFLNKRKYEEGQATYVTLIESRTQFTNAQINLSINQFNYLIRKAELERMVAVE